MVSFVHIWVLVDQLNNVVDLMLELPRDMSFKVHVDNFFTSLKSLDHLSKEKMGIIGTVRVNRMENCPLKSVATTKKQPRCSYDYRYDNNPILCVARWNNNSVVTLASNFAGVQALTIVRCWSKAEISLISITQPNMVALDNMNMGVLIEWTKMLGITIAVYNQRNGGGLSL